jgi:CRP/FNR family transcriptional regulator, cyclic AMP receptor protein
MTGTDLAGWLAAGLTLTTFSMQSMLRLRTSAIAANVCFITYGLLSGLYPVIVLHALLLPCNVLRLYQLSNGSCAPTEIRHDSHRSDEGRTLHRRT